MKCPECVRTGQRSKLYMPATYCCTDMGGTQTYYDEDGVRHHHDVNHASGRGRCSNGHILDVTASTECPAPDCGYGHPQTIDVVPAAPPKPETTEYITFENIQIGFPSGQ